MRERLHVAATRCAACVSRWYETAPTTRPTPARRGVDPRFLNVLDFGLLYGLLYQFFYVEFRFVNYMVRSDPSEVIFDDAKCIFNGVSGWVV